MCPVDVILQDEDGVDRVYTGVYADEVELADSSGWATFYYPEGTLNIVQNGIYDVSRVESVAVDVPEYEVEDKTITPDFSAGDMTVNADGGKLWRAVTVEKPALLVPENIRLGVTIAGVAGTLAVSAITTIFPRQTLTFALQASGNWQGNVYAAPSTTVNPDTKDATAIYVIEWDGTTYYCPVKRAAYTFGGAKLNNVWILGNATLMKYFYSSSCTPDLADTGEPFMVTLFGAGLDLFAQSEGEHTVAMYRLDSITLPEGGS